MKEKIKNYLEQYDIAFDTIIHPVAFSAQDVASTTHVKGIEFAKTVIIKLDDELAMAVIPASLKIDFEEFESLLPNNKVELASELEFKNKFPDCELGAMPPFGELYGMKVYVSDVLLTNDEITFNAGTHTEVIKLQMDEFRKIVNPIPLHFTKNYSL